MKNSTTQQVTVSKKNIYGVVLAGGSGERLWPLSKADRPKQLLTVGSKKTLLEQAIGRLERVVFSNRIFVSTAENHAAAICSVIGKRYGGLLIEPGARNTGPALILSCLRIYEKDPDALVLFVPADPYIPPTDEEAFAICLNTMIAHSMQNQDIALCGVKPTFPATGYGYIAYGDSIEKALPVLAFKEKPSLSLAQQYVESGMMLWNTGIFCAQASVFLAECERHAPELYADVLSVHAGAKTYDQVISISIDYAVLEKSSRCVVVPATFSWCDVGTVETFLALQKQNTPTILVDATNNAVHVPDKVVAIIGVNDLCVVETEATLLICKKSEAEKVRSVVEQLKKNGMTSSL